MFRLFKTAINWVSSPILSFEFIYIHSHAQYLQYNYPVLFNLCFCLFNEESLEYRKLKIKSRSIYIDQRKRNPLKLSWEVLDSSCVWLWHMDINIKHTHLQKRSITNPVSQNNNRRTPVCQEYYNPERHKATIPQKKKQGTKHIRREHSY